MHTVMVHGSTERIAILPFGVNSHPHGATVLLLELKRRRISLERCSRPTESRMDITALLTRRAYVSTERVMAAQKCFTCSGK